MSKISEHGISSFVIKLMVLVEKVVAGLPRPPNIACLAAASAEAEDEPEIGLRSQMRVVKMA